jgi:hypothetical protein
MAFHLVVRVGGFLIPVDIVFALTQGAADTPHPAERYTGKRHPAASVP